MIYSSDEKSYEEILEEAQRYVDELNFEEAETLYLEAIEIEPQKADAYIQLIDIYVLDGKNENVAMIINQAKENVPDADERYKIENKEEGLKGKGIQTGTVIDAYEDAITDPYYDNEPYCYHIPKIVSNIKLYDETNQIIYGELYDLLNESVYQDIDNPSICFLNYNWAENEQIISIVVCYDYPHSVNPQYIIYNISKRSGKILTDDQMLTEFGYTESTYHSKGKEVIHKYWGEYQSCNPNFATDDFFK